MRHARDDRGFGKILTGLPVENLARDTMPALCVGAEETTRFTVTTAHPPLSKQTTLLLWFSLIVGGIYPPDVAVNHEAAANRTGGTDDKAQHAASFGGWDGAFEALRCQSSKVSFYGQFSIRYRMPYRPGLPYRGCANAFEQHVRSPANAFPAPAALRSGMVDLQSKACIPGIARDSRAFNTSVILND